MTRPVVFIGGPADGKVVMMPTPLPVQCAIPDPVPTPVEDEPWPSRPLTTQTRQAVYHLARVAYGDERHPVYRAVDEPERVIERLVQVHLPLIRHG